MGQNLRRAYKPRERDNGRVEQRRTQLLEMYVRGASCPEMAQQLGVTRQHVWRLIREYKFLPQSRYMLEGALCRDWMLRHRPKEYRDIMARAAAEQSSQQQSE